MFLAILLLGGCSSSPVARDGGQDAATDQRPDRPSLPADGPVADQGLDGPVDTRPWDLPDAFVGDVTLPAVTVLYTTTPDVTALGLRTVATGSPGQPAPVTGWSGYVDLDPLGLAGQQEHLPVSPGRPRITAEHAEGLQGIRLPGGQGTLYYFHRKLLGTSGLLRLPPGGGVEVILEVPGLYPDTLQAEIALSAAGTVGAAIQGEATVLLFRTDGVPLTGGKPWQDISPVVALQKILPASLTMAGSWLYGVGQEPGGKNLLLRAPLDGSAPLAPLPLPPSGGKEPVALGEDLTVSADEQRLALRAGASLQSVDVYVIEVASGAAVNVTEAPGGVAPRGNTFGHLTGQLALSPAGSLVAYLSTVPTPELRVASTDKSSPPVQVTAASRFEDKVTAIHNLFFPDEKNLLFMAGLSSDQLDLYRWEHQAQSATNLTASPPSPPFAGKGLFSPLGGWTSPNRKWLYWIAHRSSTQERDILGLDLSVFALAKITSQAQVQTAPGTFAACAGSGALFFAAKPGVKVSGSEIWSFDQDSGQPAVKRTSMNVNPTAYWQVYHLLLSGSCDRLAWSAGGGYQLRELWWMPTAGGAPARKLAPSPGFVGSAIHFGPGESSLIYSSGGSEAATSVKALLLAGGPPVTLDPAAGISHVFATY